MSKYKTLYNNHKQLIPLVILLILCIKIIITAIGGTVELGGEEYAFVLTTRHYATFIAVALNFVIYAFFRKAYLYTLTATLLLGLFGFIGVTAVDTRTTYSINSFSINAELSCFYLLLVVLFLNLGKFGRKLSGPDEEADKRVADHKQKTEDLQIQKFKKLYINKSTEHIQLLLSEKRMSPTAQKAAEQVLQERQQNQDPS